MKRIALSWIGRMMIGLLACVGGTFIIKKFVTGPFLERVIANPELRDGVQYVLSGLVVLGLYYVVYKALEKRKREELALSDFWKEFFLGTTLGGGLISICVAMLYVLGYFELYAMRSFSVVLLPLALLFSAALLEEVVFRGIIYRLLEERFGTAIALVQAVVFGLLHYGNLNATLTSVWFVIVLGVVLSLMYTYTQRLWLPFFFHLSWNFAQIAYGTPLSGDTTFEALMQSNFNGPRFFIGSDFGIEDSFFSILFMSLLALYLYWLCKKNGKLKPRKPTA